MSTHPLTAAAARRALHALADRQKGEFLQRFFKTGKGEYAHGDRFIGTTVPQTRSVARQFSDLPLTEVRQLLRSPVHEERLLALLVLEAQFKRAGRAEDPRWVRSALYRFYCAHFRFINNWDLVDTSARAIAGAFLREYESPARALALLRQWARTRHLWTQRIAMIASYEYIRAREFKIPLAIAEDLLHHEHDLIHKAVGWMLREAGERDVTVLRAFLKKHAAIMPRTALRYAIEHFSPTERKRWMTERTRTTS